MVDLALYSISLEQVFSGRYKEYNLNQATMSFNQDHLNLDENEENEIKAFLEKNGSIQQTSSLEQFKVVFKKQNLKGQKAEIFTVYYPNEKISNQAIYTVLFMTRKHHQFIKII